MGTYWLTKSLITVASRFSFPPKLSIVASSPNNS